jgi:ATP/maltotriose-dependent transcriptional regulator MalT
MPGLLLETKLGIPSVHSAAVTRPRLFEQLNTNLLQGEGFARKLTLVSAPAGYGNTTLVRGCPKRKGQPLSRITKV